MGRQVFGGRDGDEEQEQNEKPEIFYLFPYSNSRNACSNTHHRMLRGVSFFLILFLFCPFLLFLFLFKTSMFQNFFPFLDHKLAVALITRMVPGRLAIGKIEVIDIASGILTADKRERK